MASLQISTDSVTVIIKKADSTNGDHKELNQALYHAEQQLLLPSGLPRRNWYKHSIYAPGFYTGYGVKTMPGIREAIEQRDWKEAQEQIGLCAQAINKLAQYLKSIRS
jgi:N-acetylated-alpha-linked acidic dipeptidase